MKKSFFIIVILLQAFSVFADKPAAVSITGEGSVFPNIQAQTLSDRYISLPYESTSNARVSYILITYTRPDDADMETWVKPFLEKFDTNTHTAHYSIALVGDIGFINGLIFNGMKSGTTEKMKKHLLVYFHDKNPYKKIFNITDDSLIYVYILDQKGIIRLVKSGKTAAQTDIDNILKTTTELLR